MGVGAGTLVSPVKQVISSAIDHEKALIQTNSNIAEICSSSARGTLLSGYQTIIQLSCPVRF
jgi:hypothetical protein